jgi:hypothetical protein
MNFMEGYRGCQSSDSALQLVGKKKTPKKKNAVLKHTWGSNAIGTLLAANSKGKKKYEADAKFNSPSIR